MQGERERERDTQMQSEREIHRERHSNKRRKRDTHIDAGRKREREIDTQMQSEREIYRERHSNKRRKRDTHRLAHCVASITIKISPVVLYCLCATFQSINSNLTADRSSRRSPCPFPTQTKSLHLILQQNDKIQLKLPPNTPSNSSLIEA
jgi:hypothetical protein